MVIKWCLNLVLLSIFAICVNSETNKDDLELKFVFVAVRGSAHWPCDYPGGPVIFHMPEQFSRLSWRGREDAYGYGQEISDMYRQRLGVKHWSKKNYLSLGGFSLRTMQAALVLGAGMENKHYKINWQWSEAKKSSTQFPAMQQYLKIYSSQKCPKFVQDVRSNFIRTHKLDPRFLYAYQIFTEDLAGINLSPQRRPEDIWLAYESMFNVFYSYKRRYHHKYRYWKLVREQFKKFSKELMWTSLTATEDLRKMSGGAIVHDVLNDMANITENKSINDRPDLKLAVLTATQGILAASVVAFAPNGTTLGGKPLGADDLYPEHGAMQVIEVYKQGESSWKIKVLYRKNREECLKPMVISGCENELCDYDKFKSAVKGIDLEEKAHDNLCMKAQE